MAQINLNKSSGANYELAFPVTPVTESLRDADIFTLNVHGTVIPAITIETDEKFWQGGSYPTAISPVTYEPWYVNFNVDSRWDNWHILYKWLMYIDNADDRFGRPTDEYFVDAHLHIYDNAGNTVMGLKIVNIYPTSLNEVTLSQRDGKENLECGVNFNYTKIVVDKPIIVD